MPIRFDQPEWLWLLLLAAAHRTVGPAQPSGAGAVTAMDGGGSAANCF